MYSGVKRHSNIGDLGVLLNSKCLGSGLTLYLHTFFSNIIDTFFESSQAWKLVCVQSRDVVLVSTLTSAQSVYEYVHVESGPSKYYGFITSLLIAVYMLNMFEIHVKRCRM